MGIKANALIPVMLLILIINNRSVTDKEKIHSVPVGMKGYYLCPSVLKQILYCSFKLGGKYSVLGKTEKEQMR